MANYFINKILSTKILESESLSIEYIYIILNILYAFSRLVNSRFIGKYFYEKCYENIKKILLGYSLNKKNIISKIYIDNIFAYIDKIVGFNFYPFQLLKFFVSFMITFGYNCFKTSETLEKRLLGLNTISKVLPILNNYFPILGSKTLGEITSLITDKLLNNTQNNDLFGLLFKIQIFMNNYY